VFSQATRPLKQAMKVCMRVYVSKCSAHVANAVLTITIIMSTGQSSPTIESTVLESTVAIQVFNSYGGIIRFGDLFADQKTIVVFIRTQTNPAYRYIQHFY
jgi:hypothetical protein